MGIQVGEAVPLMAADGTTPINTAQDWRSIVNGALLPPMDGDLPGFGKPGVLSHVFNPATGVFRDGWVYPRGTPGQGVEVRGGHFVVNRNGVGSYLAMIPGGQSNDLPVGPADASNPMVTSIVVRLRDKALPADAAGSEHNVYLEYVNGAPGAINLNGTRGATGAPPILGDGDVELAQLSRPTIAGGGNVITSGMITIVRRSTALMGGVRQLLEGDKLADPGLYPGELRRRRLSTHLTGYDTLTTEMTDRWDPAGVRWRGTQPITFPRPNATTGWTTTFTGAASNMYTVASLAIPDPGWL
jgi:hypothetical protein